MHTIIKMGTSRYFVLGRFPVRETAFAIWSYGRKLKAILKLLNIQVVGIQAHDFLYFAIVHCLTSLTV
jgi:hypothetical protein